VKESEMLDPFEMIKKDMERINRALGGGTSRIGEEIRQTTAKYGDKKYYLTDQGEMALGILGAWKHEPPTIVTYTELLRSLIAPLTPESERAIEEAAKSLGLEASELAVMKFAEEDAVRRLNDTIGKMVRDGLLKRLDNVSWTIEGIGSPAENAFRLMLGMRLNGWTSPSHAVTAGVLLIEASKETRGELIELWKPFDQTLSMLVKGGYIANV